MIKRHRSRIRAIRGEDGQLSEDPDTIQRILECFFRARWTEQTGSGSPADIQAPLARVSEEDTAALIRPVTESEIREVVWSLKGDKALGSDAYVPPCTRLPTKILAVRLRDILPRLINPEQGAFVGGRSISDNVLIAQEFMFDLGRASNRKSFMGIKLDIERAYNRMGWDFVQQSLQEFVFTQELEVYWPVPGATAISHLLYTDDCLLLVRLTRQAARVIWRILRDYYAVSGQRVNVTNSAICFSSKTRPAVKTSILEILGVGEQEGMLRYPGVSLSGRRLRSRDCSSLELSIRHRLEGWQMHSLSMMGRITLVRSVLSSIPIYLLSNSFIPVVLVRTLEQMFRDFIWGRGRGRRGIHLLAWKVVCQTIRYGGLGVQSLVARWKALVVRHAARFVLESDGMWSSLLRAKYGVLVPAVRAGWHHSLVWREICARAALVLLEVRWAIGDGRSIDVLEDTWVTEQSIGQLPTMVDTSRLAGYRVSDLMDPGGGRWQEGLIRETFGEHLAEMVLALPVPFRERSDRMVLMPTGRSQVRARDLQALVSREPARRIEGGWIWRLRIHPRVAIFLWKVA
ncbi:uncharacterized protein LOC120110654 [Phoenix dactylifera]|uniref:Uncharacterized protein LOC120110654 n=1 Tax=Phoenix dactylifera TaxID=42345 RepID=A0A8B9A8W9_PHODC|nr:uncharacterized protein LOC120110654 [Phoenix dactylifera]